MLISLAIIYFAIAGFLRFRFGPPKSRIG